MKRLYNFLLLSPSRVPTLLLSLSFRHFLSITLFSYNSVYKLQQIFPFAFLKWSYNFPFTIFSLFPHFLLLSLPHPTSYPLYFILLHALSSSFILSPLPLSFFTYLLSLSFPPSYFSSSSFHLHSIPSTHIYPYS